MKLPDCIDSSRREEVPSAGQFNGVFPGLREFAIALHPARRATAARLELASATHTDLRDVRIVFRARKSRLFVAGIVMPSVCAISATASPDTANSKYTSRRSLGSVAIASPWATAISRHQTAFSGEISWEGKSSRPLDFSKFSPALRT